MISGSRGKLWNTVRTALMLISCALFVGELGFSSLGSAGVFVFLYGLVFALHEFSDKLDRLL
jgi:hypothetical protein